MAEHNGMKYISRGDVEPLIPEDAAVQASARADDLRRDAASKHKGGRDGRSRSSR